MTSSSLTAVPLMIAEDDEISAVVVREIYLSCPALVSVCPYALYLPTLLVVSPGLVQPGLLFDSSSK
jgi:hypothetical protein